MSETGLKKRNAKAFLAVSFDLLESAGRNNVYPSTYKELKKQVGDENYFRTLKQYCVIYTDITEESIADYVENLVGGNCNISVMQLTSVPVFKIDDETYRDDMERLKRTMADVNTL